ncbi:MAG TPA: flagellar transcriptional regulator FlhC [Quisquiliibacterium sp.]|nr:MAG: flagellar transcriptional regulator FlhC [Burkholderiaceae bacterium]HOA92260.1 flagellar transcriptional regulator FlhC [Quisquiliibacterium sp.]HPA90330.1 flagellar transcriptional regulator FlhC [Quisquiliibacterium sp.]HQN10657.1 flagellar transcriptional regulator FlhC [Quisquiliibacterium sp.]HQP67264.1 flagellar transcriptional regulator FlhC [Quisquiliibacterium sp.]
MAARSLLEDSRQVQRAIELIGLGARLQLLQSETNLPYERLLRLYKEVAGKSPSKGQLPFSTDWFLGWQPNIHASLFFNMYEYMQKASAIDEIDAIMKAYQLYAAEVATNNVEPLLSITRAWRLVKFVDSGMLCLTKCTRCGGHFINHAYELTGSYVCGLCEPPARAGKGRRGGLIH